ncbi:MAG: DUF1016 family protein [Bacteroidetes bacterium]|nr:MAG: DUF1016 family protein [Bacteroidota bacterium]
MEIQNDSYQNLLTEIKDSIRHAQVRAGQYVNRAMIELYWHIGKTITERQETEGWGKSVVERLSQDLKMEFPNTEGFSTQNLWYMRQFYLTYRHAPILQQAVGEISWSHNLIIMAKVKDAVQQQFYLNAMAQ